MSTNGLYQTAPPPPASLPMQTCPHCMGRSIYHDEHPAGISLTCRTCGYVEEMSRNGVLYQPAAYVDRKDRKFVRNSAFPPGLTTTWFQLHLMERGYSRGRVDWRFHPAPVHVFAINYWRTKHRWRIYSAEVTPALPGNLGPLEISALKSLLRNILRDTLWAYIQLGERIQQELHSWEIEPWGRMVRAIEDE